MKYRKSFQTFGTVLSLLNYRIRIEKEISLMDDKIYKYEERW